MLMIDFDGGMDFIESERDIYTKKQLLIVHVYSNLHIDWKKLLKIITEFCTFLIGFGSKRFGVCAYRTHGNKEMPFTTNLFITIS